MTKLTPPGAATSGPYEPREFDLTAVTGLSQRAIEGIGAFVRKHG